MESATLKIPNISCGHCVMSIKNELSDLEGVCSVKGDPASKQITVEWEAPLTKEDLLAALKAMNYPAA